MKIDNKTIIIPWDFTEVAENALAHAIRIAKHTGNNIQLMNVVDSKSKVAPAEKKLKADADHKFKDTGIEYDTLVVSGSIFSEISDYASEKNVNMVLMGTHGIRGMQKFIGSNALKVIAGSKVPFLVVQDKPISETEFSDIVFPIDFTSETKEKVNWAVGIGKAFQSKVHIFKSPIMDSSLNKKVNVNLNFATRFLEQNKIKYDITVGKKSNDFAKETVEYAKKINADLLIIMTHKNLNIGTYILGADEQEIIANKHKIPVMCINPMSSFADSGLYLFGA